MERVFSTVASGVGCVTLFYLALLPGGLGRRALVGLLAASVGMAVFLGGMALCDLPLQAGHLQVATALGLLVVALTVEVPTRLVARAQGIPPEAGRGVTILAMVVACFVAAWVAGRPPVPPSSSVEVSRVRP